MGKRCPNPLHRVLVVGGVIRGEAVTKVILAAPHRLLAQPLPREEKPAARPPIAASGQSLSLPLSNSFLPVLSARKIWDKHGPHAVTRSPLSGHLDFSNMFPLIPSHLFPVLKTCPVPELPPELWACFASPHHSSRSINNPPPLIFLSWTKLFNRLFFSRNKLLHPKKMGWNTRLLQC